MATDQSQPRPRNFYLNELHELSLGEKTGGGRIPDYVGILWTQKGQRISESLDRVAQRVKSSKDPLREKHFFAVAQPVAELRKRSTDKRKAPNGTYAEPTSFGGVHGRTFERLGLDLIQVTDDGRAIVHGDAERLEQLAARSRSLGSLGAREQARWATIDLFEAVPPQIRIDGDWLSTLKATEAADVVFELQPVLSRVDADQVLRAIAAILAGSGVERLLATGTDFSGRFWFRGKASLLSIRSIAREFFSVQSIHSPLFSATMATSRTAARKSVSIVNRPAVAVDGRSLPCVAIVDLGIPEDHVHLAQYRRGRFVPQEASAQALNDHASFVASRVVFGDCETSQELESATAACSFYDVVVGDGYENRVNDKIVMDALRGVRGAAPDVRVFNLSIGDARPLGAFPEVEGREKRLLMQDLDNFVFANDVLIVVAAGNSPSGLAPTHSYPSNFHDPQWALGPWAAGYNTLVCGSYVKEISTSGLVTTAGWPSAFSRVGPGICGAPIPSFCAEGGNSNANYQFDPGLGVWGFSGTGFAEDRPGTSNAAPVLAREAALAFRLLQEFCAPGSVPFAVTVRAFLALTAEVTTADSAVEHLANRTLGFGKASSERIARPKPGSAVLVWQGQIESPKDVVRVQIPIPQAWLLVAGEPVLRLCVCYDPPVNDAAKSTWACRKVNAVLHTGPESVAVRAPTGAHSSYPLFSREYKLSRFSPDGEKAASDDMWLLELKYDEVFDYPPGMSFDPRQRVAFVAELADLNPNPVDPQRALQALPLAVSMTRLSIGPTTVRNPVLVRTRIR